MVTLALAVWIAGWLLNVWLAGRATSGWMRLLPPLVFGRQ